MVFNDIPQSKTNPVKILKTHSNKFVLVQFESDLLENTWLFVDENKSLLTLIYPQEAPKYKNINLVNGFLWLKYQVTDDG